MSTRPHGAEFQPGAFRKKRNLVLGALSEAASPLLRPLASLMSKGVKSDPAQWRKGLILGHSHIGDVLYRTASLRPLHESLPECEWSYLTSSGSAEILGGNPYVHEVLPWMHGLGSSDIDRQHRDELARRTFDVVLCTNTLRHYPELVMATWLGIPNRVAFTHKGLSGLVNRPVPIEFPSAYAGYFRSMVATIVERAPDWSLAPEIFLADADRNEAQLARNRAELSMDRPILACSLTTRQAHGNWPVKSMLAIIREARSLRDFSVALCGSAEDATILSSYASELGGDVSVLAGQLSVRGFAAFLEQSAALFTLDSGPRHIGNAVGTHVVFARNMSHSEVEAGKYCETETDIAPKGEYLGDPAIQVLAEKLSIRGAARVVFSAIEAGAAPA